MNSLNTVSLLQLPPYDIDKIVLTAVASDGYPDIKMLNILSLVCKALNACTKSDTIWNALNKQWQILLIGNDLRQQIKDIAVAIKAIPNINLFEKMLPMWRMDLEAKNSLSSNHPAHGNSILSQAVSIYQCFLTTFQKADIQKILQRPDFQGVLTDTAADEKLQDAEDKQTYLLRLRYYDGTSDSDHTYKDNADSLEFFDRCVKWATKYSSREKYSLDFKREAFELISLIKDTDFFNIDVLDYFKNRNSSYKCNRNFVPISSHFEGEDNDARINRKRKYKYADMHYRSFPFESDKILPENAFNSIDTMVSHLSHINACLTKERSFYKQKFKEWYKKQNNVAVFRNQPLETMQEMKILCPKIPEDTLKMYSTRADFHGQLSRNIAEEKLESAIPQGGISYLLRLTPNSPNTVIFSILFVDKTLKIKEITHTLFDGESADLELQEDEIEPQMERERKRFLKFSIGYNPPSATFCLLTNQDRKTIKDKVKIGLAQDDFPFSSVKKKQKI